jgi:hypothetical protein
MLTMPVQGNGTPNRWTPAPYIPPAAQYQTVKAPSPKLGDPPVSAAENLARSPMIAFVTDIAAASASAYLAWGLNVRRNTCLLRVGEKGYPIEKCPGSGWSTFWWIMSTAMAVKALHDLSEMNA